MKRLVDNIPFLRFTAALSAGILFSSFLQEVNNVLYGILILLIPVLLLLNACYKFKFAAYFGIGIHIFFFVTGALLSNLYNSKPVLYRNGRYAATVLEILQEKMNSYQSVLEVNYYLRNDSVFSTNEKVLVYFAKDERAKNLIPGQTILFEASPQVIENSDNPFEFNYKKYMERRKIYRQLYLPSDAWIHSFHETPFHISVLAEQVRMLLLNTYINQNWNEQQLNVLSALTLGYKRGLDPEIKRVFASAGALHILAVSGLHVGILFLMITILFGFLKKQQSGKIFFVFIVIITLWGFAFITGLSPSVKRAAVMLSFVVVGQSLQRQINIYNTITASAFFLLLLNPDNLYEAGFQLSYAAVFGIVYLQPRFEKLYFFRLKLLRYFWKLLTVSVAAQIATLPIAVYYFNQLPVYFWITNLLIIPAVTLLIPLGIFLLSFSWVPFISAPIAEITGNLLNFLIYFLGGIERLPQSVFKIHFSAYELVFILASMFSVFFFIEYRKQRYLKSGLLFFLMFLLFSIGKQAFNMYRSEIIVYNYSEQNVLHFISGKKNYVVSEYAFSDTDFAHRLIDNTVMGLQMHQPVYLTYNECYNDSVLYLKEGVVLFDGHVVSLQSANQEISSPFIPDLLVDKRGILSANSENITSKRGLFQKVMKFIPDF